MAGSHCAVSCCVFARVSASDQMPSADKLQLAVDEFGSYVIEYSASSTVLSASPQPAPFIALAMSLNNTADVLSIFAFVMNLWKSVRLFVCLFAKASVFNRVSLSRSSRTNANVT